MLVVNFIMNLWVSFVEFEIMARPFLVRAGGIMFPVVR